jgi:hypothetical protein
LAGCMASGAVSMEDAGIIVKQSDDRDLSTD